MSDDIPQKRRLVKEAYDGKTWHDKVDKMSDQQIIAVYFRLKRTNKI